MKERIDSDREKKRLVIKIGSSTLTTSECSIDYEYLSGLAGQIASLSLQGWQIVVVTSAAIACGLEALGISRRPDDMPSLQAAASVGQSALSSAYARAFSNFDILTSIVLLTRRDTADRKSYLHARDTFDRLLDLGVVPIVNENDTVSVEQIRFGDNDTLSALVACLIEADLLLILSDVDGLFDVDPAIDARAHLLGRVDRIDRRIIKAAGKTGSRIGSGGMATKIHAARILMAAGIPMVVANGHRDKVIIDAASGNSVGTLFMADGKTHEITPRKLWIALGDAAHGSLVIDDGARRALVECGSSLLCVGVVRIDGHFDADDIIDIEDEYGIIVARGKIAFSSDEVALAIGRSRDELVGNRILSSLACRPLVHRDDLMVFE